MKKGIIAALSIILAVSGCAINQKEKTDIGIGFEASGLNAPWDSDTNGTRFTCHATNDRFFFNFEADDSTVVFADTLNTERDIDPYDRVEVFFSPDREMESYYCAEIDPKGRIMDYNAHFYRNFDFGWDFSTMETFSAVIPGGYRVEGSVSLAELRQLGMDLEKGFMFGVFQGDCGQDGLISWYSLIATDDAEPDFHKPDVLFPVRMTPKAEKRGVVIYPSDVKVLGIHEWERRFKQSGINLVGLHAATMNEPLDELEAFVKSKEGQDFLKLCKRYGIDVEYEIHALQLLMPRNQFDVHPEYFRQGQDGRRLQMYNMCFTSKEAIESMRPQIKAMMEWMHPTTHRYFIWTDDKIGAFCTCDECREYSPSEQALIYENRLLALLREYDPEATLAHLAYNQTLEAPVKVAANEGIFLEFAPINRNYSESLSESALESMKHNMLAFPTYSIHILEYWLDESMFSHWKKKELVPLPFNKNECARDVSMYRKFGATSITSFATWLNDNYIERYGPTDDIFTGYRDAFDFAYSAGNMP